MLAAINGFFRFIYWHIKVKFLKIQRSLFRDTRRELPPKYDRLALIMEPLCATGIRISGLRCITVEAAKQGTGDTLSQRPD